MKAGVAVWDPHERRKAAPRKAMSSKERRVVLARDGYMCTLCGIAGAEPYRDDPVMTAVLSISRRKVRTLEGAETEMLVTECNRCRSGQANAQTDMGDFVAAAEGLHSPGDRRRLLRWMERGRRGMTELDHAWRAYLSIPVDLRPEMAEQLRVQK